MNANRPNVSHVAVRGGRILGAGTLAELEGWGDYVLDERFKDKVLMPGFVEGHGHSAAGALWDHVYVGWFDDVDSDGKRWSGLKSVDDVVERLKRAGDEMTDQTTPVIGWGFDPIYMSNKRIGRADLDRVSTTRPVVVMQASGHIMNVNTRALELAGMLRTGHTHPGIPLGDDGLPAGELKSPEIMTPVGRHFGLDSVMVTANEASLRNYARLCVRAGVTTTTDLGVELDDTLLGLYENVTGEPDYPVCLVVLRIAFGATPTDLVDYCVSTRNRTTERLDLGRIKVIADGSIQGFTARLRWPGYYNGAENGLWYIAPSQLEQIYELALMKNVQVHTHTNGDEATQLAIDCLGSALGKIGSADHRFTLQHCQLASTAQFRQMASLGMCVNLFANHHFYWGDEHSHLTVGPERAKRMNACRTALEAGVPMTIHSDVPVTPLAPLFTAWAAVNRLTASGRVLGAHQCISVHEALRAITLGAAYTLKLDDEIGSIEVGKRADFAVLEGDPTEVDPISLKDVRVWGTVQGGRIFAAADI
nr:amidohydrolase [Defluviimonas salinarum]